VIIGLVTAAVICIPIATCTAFIIGYFGVGSWHVVSMLIHFFNKWFTDKSEARYNYHWTVFVILLLAFAGILIEPIL
jgi:4TM region of DNA translocase FtsK/SpoIIIE